MVSALPFPLFFCSQNHLPLPNLTADAVLMVTSFPSLHVADSARPFSNLTRVVKLFPSFLAFFPLHPVHVRATFTSPPQIRR